MGTDTLHALGWDSFFADQLRALEKTSLVPARVVNEQRGVWHLMSAAGTVAASLTGKMRTLSRNRLHRPAVGDWVGIAGERIEHLLRRRTRFVRTAAGGRGLPQVVAANVDLVFVVTALNREFSPRRLERYLMTVRGGGAEPIVVLNKSDLAEDPETFRARTAEVSSGSSVHICSATEGSGIETLRERVGAGLTAALVGSSGVGKSTLVNALLGHEVQAVGTIREVDDKGRHTTSHRELFHLPGNGMLIDTPGMRELQVWESSLESTFPRVTALAARCRFRNCSHEHEPDCQVRAALESGELDHSRLESYRKLRAEAAAARDVNTGLSDNRWKPSPRKLDTGSGGQER